MIEFRDVQVSYQLKKGERFEAVKNFNLTIEDGALFGIAGSSGAGKSSIIRTLNLLERPSKGHILVDGREIGGLQGTELQRYRQTTGMVFQHFNLIGRKTVAQNILFALNAGTTFSKPFEKEARVDELLDLVGLSDKKHAYPSQLSGGQQQRVGIARALANNPRLLLCDEPTSALDAETTASILELLKNIHSKLGLTIVLITHELDVIKKICTHAAVMDKGELLESSPVYQLFARPKHPFTKKLVSHSFQLDLPTAMNPESLVLKLTYLEDEADKPSLAQAAARFPVDINIIHGKIDYISATPLGVLKVQLSGKEGDVLNAAKFLSETVSVLEIESANELSSRIAASIGQRSES